MNYISFLTNLMQYIPSGQRLGNFRDCVSVMAGKLQGIVDGIPTVSATPKNALFLDKCIEYALSQMYHGKISYDDFARKMGDNIKKVANLFVISDFCSIWIDPHNPLNFSVLCHFL